MRPGYAWADRFDLKRVGWADHEWHHYDPPLTATPLFFVIPYPDSIYEKAAEWLLGDEAATLEASAQAAANTFLSEFIKTANDTVGYVDFRNYLDQVRAPDSWQLSPILSGAGRAIRLMLNRASSAIGRPRKEWDRIP